MSQNSNRLILVFNYKKRAMRLAFWPSITSPVVTRCKARLTSSAWVLS